MVGTPGGVALNRLLTPTQHARETQPMEDTPLVLLFRLLQDFLTRKQLHSSSPQSKRSNVLTSTSSCTIGYRQGHAQVVMSSTERELPEACAVTMSC